MQARTAALALGLLMSCAVQAQAQDAQSWCKSKWGPDDEKGAANHLTDSWRWRPPSCQDRQGLPARRRDQLQDPRLSRRAPSTSRSFSRARQAAAASAPTKTTYNDDIITGWVGIGSQLDGLGHIGVDHVYYNCNKAARVRRRRRAQEARHREAAAVRHARRRARHDGGRGQEPGSGRHALQQEGDRRGARPSRASRSGRATWCSSTPAGRTWQRAIPRRSWRASRASARKEPSTWSPRRCWPSVRTSGALEVVPFEKGVGVFEVHQILLPRNGVYILENMNTAPARCRQGVGVHVRARARPHHRRGAGHHQSGRHPLSLESANSSPAVCRFTRRFPSTRPDVAPIDVLGSPRVPCHIAHPNAPFVYRLGRQIFNLKRRVRTPVGSAMISAGWGQAALQGIFCKQSSAAGQHILQQALCGC